MIKVAKEDLKRSGITVQEAEEAEMYSVKDASKTYPEFKQAQGLIIPYVDPWTDDFMEFEREGDMLPFYRVRYFDKADKVRGFKKKKAIRYGQPKDSGVHPYFPLADGIDWREIAEDADIPIMITEGEKKSLAACLAGVPTIGLGGVYNFTHDGELLPVLDKIKWSQRVVYICYDSDAGDNNKIQVAEGRLATELSLKRNASVFLVRLPELPGGAKMGIDDFLEAKGDDALFELLDKAPEMRKIDKEILRMNGEVAWIAKEGLLLDLRTDTWLKKGDFTLGSDFSTRQIMVPKAKGDGVKFLSIAQAFLTHPHSRRYTDTIFRPGTEDKAIQLPRGGVAYNRFRGLDEEEGDVYPFFELYDWVLSRTDEFDPDLIWKTMAYKMQNLEEKIGLGVIFLGKQGSGKTLLCDILAEMVEPYNHTMDSDEMSSEFNGWKETSLIVVMNESKSAALKYNMEKLKAYVTDIRQPMNEKYRANRQINCYGFFLFNSNELSAGAFSDDDRRMIVIGCPNTHPQGDDFYSPVWAWRKAGGPKKLLNFFKNYDLEGWEPPRHAPDTRQKRMAYYASLTPLQKVGDAMLKADTNIVVTWIAAAMSWASSGEASSPQQIALASQIAQNMMHIQIRPFYTPEELTLLFPAISGTLAMGKVREATPANVLAQELMQIGIDYLRCEDNYDGFIWNGQTRQFLVVTDHEKYREPISQEKFEKIMCKFPTYKEHRARNKNKKSKRKHRG